MPKATPPSPPAGEKIAEHLLDLISAASGDALARDITDIVIDPGEPGYKEHTWRKAF